MGSGIETTNKCKRYTNKTNNLINEVMENISKTEPVKKCLKT
jgi:hypothetical protein